MRGGSLKARIIILGLGAAIIPVVIIIWLTIQTNISLRQEVGQGLKQQAHDILEGMAANVYELCQTQNAAGSHIMKSSLEVAKDILRRHGEITSLPEEVEWRAVNQFTKNATKVKLPKMAVGGVWWGQVSQAQTPVPVVDDTAKLVGGTCTIFQRLNPQGDMIRVATNVLKVDGTRAIGTYIPAVNPDGKPNPVISAILKGQPYIGRAFVVNDWYTTAYEPLKDSAGNLIGIIYVGIKQSEMPGAKSLRAAILNKKIGKSGYVFVLEASGAKKGHYVVSQGGERDGQDIWDQKDANGKLVVQEMIKAATQKSPTKMAFQEYLWQDRGDPQPRVRLAAITYFPPWDWVISASVFKDELQETQQRIEESYRSMIRNLIVIGLLTIILVAAVSIFWGGSLSRPISRSISSLQEISDDVTAAADQVSTAGQSLSQGATSQAASLEETSSSLEEMASMARRNADNAQEADSLITETGTVVNRANTSMTDLTHSMEEISAASGETAKIIKTIDEIAFQTNLLALNAAVEAARAGEAGSGFAVVADEVRHLAMRAADAAKNTATLIEKTVNKVQGGSELVHRTAVDFQQVAGSTVKVKDLVAEIAAASREQAEGVEQINRAVAEMDKVVQSNAANAEESAGASTELSVQSEQMKKIVEDLAVLTGNRSNGRHSAGTGRRLEELPRRPALKSKRQLAQTQKGRGPVSGTQAPDRMVSPEQIIPLEEKDFKEF